MKKCRLGSLLEWLTKIGNDFFSANEERVPGLLEEIYADNSDAVINPHFFFNFVRERFPQLVPDENTRKRILEIWGKELPEERAGLSREPIRVEEWLQNQKTGQEEANTAAT